MPDLLLFLLLGHYLGDFALQSDKMAQLKVSCLKTLTIHVLIYTLTLGALLYAGLIFHDSPLLFSKTTLFVLIFIFIEHWTQDYIKGHKFNVGNQAFYFDQGLHVVVLYAIRLFVYNG